MFFTMVAGYTDSAFRGTALLGFAILCDNVATIIEGDNQRD